ncbi:MAG: hypothetical protein Kilf2KO_42950 [Rhodospirillales bacterium]
MRARHIPFLVGGFMILPLVMWLGLWIFALPGPKHGVDLPLTLAMGLVSLPLVAWFYMATLGMLSNSIAGRSEFHEARSWNAHRFIAALPIGTLVLGLATLPAMIAVGKAWYLVPVPFLISITIAWAIRAGERGRTQDLRVANRKARSAPPRLALARPASLLLRLLYSLPLIGPLLREGIAGSNSDRGFFALTLLLAAITAVFLFGYPALIATALTATLVAFGFILVVANG